MKLKQYLVSYPVLAFPRTDCEFIVDTDASEFGIGAVLSQVQGGSGRVISFASRTLSKSERNYCTTRRELLALVFFIKQFRHYLYGKKFTARTDHKALQWLFSIKDPEGQVARWITQLSEYDFQIIHREGKKHLNADGLSRIPCRQCGFTPTPEPNTLAEIAVNSSDVIRKTRALPMVRSQIQGTAGGSPQDEPSDHMVDGEANYIQQKQRSDPVVREALTWVRDKKKPDFRMVEGKGPGVKDLWSKYEQLVVKDGVLYLQWENDISQSVQLKLLLPKEMIKKCHVRVARLTIWWSLRNGQNIC